MSIHNALEQLSHIRHPGARYPVSLARCLAAEIARLQARIADLEKERNDLRSMLSTANKTWEVALARAEATEAKLADALDGLLVYAQDQSIRGALARKVFALIDKEGE